MKGVILAGGLGTRLRPLTKITNKHLLPIYDKPMIYYPIEAMVNAGIEDILIVCGGNHAGEFLRLLGNGKEFGLPHLNYTYQEGEAGIADALSLTRYFVGDDKVAVMLGDNLIEKNFKQAVDDFEKQERGAKILLKEVPNPKPYGVAEVKDGQVLGIEEKPENPKSNLAVIGIYMYDANVFKIVEKLEPSARGELEITDVNNAYIQRGEMTYSILDGWWGDAGESFESMMEVSNLVYQTGANHKS
ncbi:MAG: NTP transferase domain-containing protein [Candidatus Omnitrophica bacterium]|nr:NTP transferase domain-containing protein [Candidatus Omnitrophota bacterium]MCA9431930.1 NTP transferase domain-containing protein [Candidatus Omnitrophota bacterium]MCB9767696.1 NTP transferase domain-containing protein [Candidatus Omnitrophota bacterium]